MVERSAGEDQERAVEPSSETRHPGHRAVASVYAEGDDIVALECVRHDVIHVLVLSELVHASGRAASVEDARGVEADDGRSRAGVAQDEESAPCDVGRGAGHHQSVVFGPRIGRRSSV